MISQDDIEAFAAEHEADMRAAAKYANRAARGIPADRWAIGRDGEASVARGIRALFAINEMLSGAFTAIWNDKVQAGQDAMRLHYPDTERADTRHGA